VEKEEAIRRAEGNLNASTERLQKLAASNAPYGSRQGAENNHSAAYQALVRLGVRQPLRKKYR
jgi:hypothetical protein